MPTRAVVVHSRAYACDIGPHVFPTVKCDLVLERLLADRRIAPGDVREPAPASPEQLALVHSAEYLDDLATLRFTERTAFAEVPLSRSLIDAHVLAAGGTLLAARAALSDGTAIHLGGGFHHASAARAEGFCYINDVAVAVRVLQAEGAVRRAAVVDLDVHQGNGTAKIFEGDRSVFTLSLHQENNYPEPKATSDLDVGLADGTGDDAYDEALARALDHVWAAAPDLVVYVAGADPYVDDQLGGLALTLEGLERRDRRVLEGCAARAVPCAITLAGGYARHLEDTVRIHARTAALALDTSAALERRS